jgi:hypothetical protein
MDKEMVKHLLDAPDTQLDAAMKPLIEKWADPATPLQILEVLDHCIHGSLASGFVVTLLQIMYDTACKREGTTHEEVLKGAAWRQRDES